MTRPRHFVRLRLLRLSIVTALLALPAARAGASARAERSVTYNRAVARATVGNQTDKHENSANGNPAPQVSASASASRWFGKADALATAGPQATKVMTKVVGLGGAGIAQNSGGRTPLQSDTPSSSEDSVSAAVTITGPSTLDIAVDGYFDVSGAPATTGATMKFVLAVYPDTLTSQADSLGNGTGASFYGRLTVQEPGAGASVAGAFSTSDFIVDATKTQPIKVYTVPNLTYHVSGVNSANAVVSLHVDPESTVPTAYVPAVTPASALAMLGGLAALGALALARRRRAAG